MPANFVPSSAPAAVTALDATVAASRGFLGNFPFLKPGRGRLTTDPSEPSIMAVSNSNGSTPLSVPAADVWPFVVPAEAALRVPGAAEDAVTQRIIMRTASTEAGASRQSVRTLNSLSPPEGTGPSNGPGLSRSILRERRRQCKFDEISLIFSPISGASYPASCGF